MQAVRHHRGHRVMTVAVRFHEQLPYARCRLGPHLHRSALRPRGQGMPSPRGRNLGHAVLGARPAADGLSRGRRLGRTPPIDLRRNATSRAGVTRPGPATLRIRGATNGVGVPWPAEHSRVCLGPSGREVGGELLSRRSRVETSPVGRLPATADPDHLFDQLPLVVGDLGQAHRLPGRRGRPIQPPQRVADHRAVGFPAP
jgi:hypothetical protein